MAQLVAQAICNRQVVGSSPTTGSDSYQVKGRFLQGHLYQKCLSRAGSPTKRELDMYIPGSYFPLWLRHLVDTFRTRLRHLGDTGSDTCFTHELT